MSKTRYKSRWYLVFSLLLAGVLLFLAFRGVDWREILKTMREARPDYLALGCIISSAAFFFRGLRWRVLLSAERLIAPIIVFWATMLGYLSNNLLPGRAGELIRSAALGRRCDISTSFVFATALTERIMDAMALIMISLVAVFLLGDLPVWLSTAVKVTGIVGLLGVGGLFVASRLENLLSNALIWVPVSNSFRAGVVIAMEQFLLGMRAFQHSGRAFRFAMLTLVIWLTEALGSVVLARAMNMSLDLLQALFLLASLGLSSIVPLTPGYVGVYQFVAATILPAFGFSQSQALTYIIVVQTLYYAVVTAWGLLGLWQLDVSQAVSSP